MDMNFSVINFHMIAVPLMCNNTINICLYSVCPNFNVTTLTANISITNNHNGFLFVSN